MRGAGGLLVLGTSLNESKRIELQLRGRAGRQGDPGETKMLIDAQDPLLSIYGLDKASVMLRQVRRAVAHACRLSCGRPGGIRGALNCGS